MRTTPPDAPWHALTIDDGWREVADVALGLIRRFVGKQVSGSTGALDVADR